MVIKGRSRGNGAQLADYLLNSKENEKAQVLEVRGTSHPNNLKNSLLEMSLSSKLTKGVHGLYHAQINPAIGEDRPMTSEDWLKAAEVLEQNLKLEGQKRAIVLHEKNGRVHAHVVWERYDHEKGKLRTDSQSYRKHDKAREDIELMLGHERTRQQEKDAEPTHEKTDHKRELSKLWDKAKDGKSFIKEAEKLGYLIAKDDDRRPWRVITPEGKDLDLVRQLSNAKTKDVRERLQPLKNTLPTIEEALKVNAQEKRNRSPKRSDNNRELSDSQDLMIGMKNLYNQEDKTKKDDKNKVMSYSSRFKVVPSPLPQAFLDVYAGKSDNNRNLSDSQELADAMLKNQQKGKSAIEPKEVANDNTKSDNKRELSDSQKLAEAMLQKQKIDRDEELKKEASNNNDPLAQYRYNKDNDPLAQYRAPSNDRDRDNDLELTRERKLGI